MRLLIGLLVFLFVAAGPREAAAQSAPKCPAGARLAATPPGLDKLTISAQPGAARVGEPVTVAWSLPGVQRSAARRAYLVVLVPDAARVDGAGFFALRPGAPNPAGMSFGRDRTRAIVPLHTAFADASGKIEILPFEAGPLALEWAVVATDGCAEAVAANGRLAPMMITGGRPRLVLRDEFSARQPERTIRANNGPFEVRVYKGQFEVFDTATGVLVLRRDGSEPTFSPTGRFLTAKTPLGETFEALDLVSGRVIGRYETSRLHWSHADSFLWFEDEHVSKMQIVRTLHGRRHELTQHVATRREAKYERVKAGLAKDMDEEAEDRRPRPPTVDIEPEGTTCSRGCYAREDWQLELSLDHGMAIFLDTRVGRENPALLIILVYDLGAGRENALFVRGAKGRADFKTRFGFDLPALKGWRIGDKLAVASCVTTSFFSTKTA